MIGQGPASAALIPLLPLLSFVLCALCAAFKVRSKLPAWITVVCIGAAFGMTVSTYMAVDSSGKGGAFITHLFDWIN